MGVKSIYKVERALKEAAYRLTIPKIDAWIEDGRIKARALGLRGRYFQPFVNLFCQRLNKAKVIAKVNGANAYTLYNPPLPTPAGMRAMEARIRAIFFKLHTPTTATMSVTYRCQCKCVHCSAEYFKAREKEELTSEEFKRVIDGATNLGVINFTLTGGEPMLRKDLYEIIAHVDKSKAQAMMFTNGWYLSQENVDRLKEAGLYALNISIDHVDPEVHDQLRGLKNCYQRAFDGAERARRAGILTGISTYACANNIRDGSLEKLLKLAQELGFHEVTIFDCMPAGKFLKQTNKILTQEERGKLIELARKYVAMDHPMGAVAQSWINSPLGTGCFGGYYQFYLTAYGDVNPCDFNPISFGNVRESSIEEIWTRLTSHGEYRKRRMECRIQNPDYRKQFIDPIPDGAQFPVPIEEVEQLRKQSSRSLPACRS